MEIRIHRPTPEELVKLGVESWPIWEKEVSEFPWHYDETESCYILEGEAEVSAGGKTYRFGAGDFVVFPEGLDCRWTIRKAVRKHYSF
jgi:uncharacterized cupin superfamily protein